MVVQVCRSDGLRAGDADAGRHDLLPDMVHHQLAGQVYSTTCIPLTVNTMLSHECFQDGFRLGPFLDCETFVKELLYDFLRIKEFFIKSYLKISLFIQYIYIQ